MKIDFSNPEIWKNLEKQAYSGTLEIGDFPPCEYKYFSELRNIYYAFKFEGLSRSDAETRKKNILRQYQEEKNNYDYYFRFVRDWNSNNIKSDLIRSQISKSSDLVEKLKLAVECIADLTGDHVFSKVEKRYLEKLIKSGTQQNWISVRDRLPETRNPVLVTNEYGDFYLANCSSGLWTEHFREKANFLSVTHWMPLPDPPKQKGESEL